MSQNPDTQSDPQTDPEEEGGDPDEGATPVTDVQESDPNADSAAGLAGGMGVSSERVGLVRGSAEPATSGTLETYPDEPTGTGLPEQSPAGPEVRADPPLTKPHTSRLHGNPARPRSGG